MNGLHAAIGECVGAIISRVVVVSLDPVPAHPVLRRQCVELAPQFRVLDSFAIGRFPAVALPAMDPGLDPVLHVLRVGIDVDVAFAVQRFERANDRGELHPIVRRCPRASPR